MPRIEVQALPRAERRPTSNRFERSELRSRDNGKIERRLEPDEVKVSSPVLRGGGRGDALPLTRPSVVRAARLRQAFDPYSFVLSTFRILGSNTLSARLLP